MRRNCNFYLIFITIVALVLFGCNSDKKEVEKPVQKVVIAFFDAIYNKKDLNRAVLFSSKNLKKELKQYKTVRHLSRRLLNMSFDSVTIETTTTKTQIIDEFNVQITMTVMFTGQLDGSLFKDYKNIRVIKENNAWLVDKILNKI